MNSILAKLRKLEESDMAQKDPHQLLDEMKSEVSKLRTKANQTLTKDFENRVSMLHELEEVISSAPMTTEQVSRLEAEIGDLTRESTQLMSRLDAMHSSADGKM